MRRLHEVGAELVKPIRGIVFDKDGTLADLERRWVPFFGQIIATVARHGGDPAAETSLAAALGVGPDRLEPGSPAAVKSEGELLAIAVEHLTGRGWPADDAVAAIIAGVEAATFGPLVPLGDVVGAMTSLTVRFQLGVATSDNRANTVEELTALGVSDLLTALHCGDDGKGVKPDPEVLWGISRGWGLEPPELLFVGDSEQDLATARAAGCPFVAVDTNGPSMLTRSADAWVTSIDELPSALDPGSR
jgi:phosphoglycolate phosphatase